MPVNNPNERHWLAALERLDLDTVRGKLTTAGPGIGANVPGIVERGEEPSRRFVEDWLAKKVSDQRRTDTRRFWALLILGIVTAVIAAVAAWPVIKG